MNRILGIIYAVASAIAFGFMPVFVRVAYDGGLNAVTVVFLRFIFASGMLVIYFFIRKISFKLSMNQLIKLALLGIFGYASTGLTLYLSYRYISLGLATAIHFVYPSIVAILSFILYKEKLGWSKIAALLLSVAGVYVLVGPGGERPDTAGAILAFVSGVLYALYIVEVGKGVTANLRSEVITLYLCLFSSLGIAGYGLATNSLHLDVGLVELAAVVGLALICTVFAILCFSKAVQLIGSTESAVLSTFEPITGIIAGMLFFSEKMTLSMAIGSFLVVISTLLFCYKKK